jgi:hypothetical protein
VKEAIISICKNIDSGAYPWEEKRHWDRYGIIIIGNRSIIDNPPA